MEAVILAGGKGTRLRPYTTILPKPLMPIGDMPILEILLRQMKQAGIDSVVFRFLSLPPSAHAEVQASRPGLFARISPAKVIPFGLSLAAATLEYAVGRLPSIASSIRAIPPPTSDADTSTAD